MTFNGERAPSGERNAVPSAASRAKPDAALLAQLLARARNAHQAGSMHQAEQAYAELLALDGDHPDALHLLGALRFQQGRLDEAEPLMRRSIQLQPAPLSLANYSAVLAGLGQVHDALARLDDALTIDPAHARALFQRAGLLDQLGRYADACSAYDSLLAKAPDFADGYVRRSEARRAMGQAEDALRDCDRALQLAGRNFGAQRARGLALRAL
uniref:tetratricopeptide repeat protein n=1 Tax=Burkholderia sp. Ac-20379 TaxID=2703900 RepID=UPI00197D4CFA